jgi:DNA polymerase-3 subunit beta
VSDFKVRADRAALADAAAWVAQALPKMAGAPAFFGARLTAVAVALTIAAFNYEVSMTAMVPAEVMGAGEVLVAGGLLREIVAAVKGKDVELVLDGNRLAITAGRSTYRVGTMRLEDYPKLPDFPPVVGRIESGDLAAAVGAVEHAASRDEISASMAVLTAVHLESEGEQVAASATDRFRIARTRAGWDGKDFTANVPAVSLTAMLKGLRGPLEVGASEGQFGLRDGSRSATTRLFDDTFPKLGPHLNAASVATVEVDAPTLAGACKRAGMVTEANTAVHLRIGPGEIELDASSGDGEGSEFVECTGDAEFEAGYNPAFLHDALAAIDGTAVLGLPPSPTKPLTIRPLDGEDVFVVMPRRSTR